MATDTPRENSNPESTNPESAPRREATPRTWLRRIARRKRMLTNERWRQLDAVAREGINDDNYATTMATLEAMARNLGWDESQASDEPRERRGHPGHRHHGHGHGHRHHGKRDGRCGARATVEA